ncbi:MAG: UDP-N-acetylmuramoyl-L-alanine--D-glutamate ligase [Pseudonocardiales bacterium]|nr:UDP-N-acetylmuramoyl-L-alanine--D-glutamate ligase [Pseudonocardiales bacterium]
MRTVADLVGARVLVAGARVTGMSAARFLADLGAQVTVTDSAPSQLQALAATPLNGAVQLVAGLEAPPPGTDLVVTSPGLRPDAPMLVAAQRAGVPVIGDVTLARWVDRARSGERSGPGQAPAEWLVVTGTNGKTTTVGMLESILLAAGVDAVACGNIGLPVLDAVRAGHRVLAVELSSFQLHHSPGLMPRAAVVLNVSADHLDWHGCLERYAEAKGRAYDEGTTAVFNADDAWSTRLAAGHRGVGFTAGEPAMGQLGLVREQLVDRAFDEGAGTVLAEVCDIRPAGRHNVSNALAAAALARCIGVAPAAVADGLRAFVPGEHRGAPVGEHAGVCYFDDSKATNPHAARAALLSQHRVVWVAGGLLKGVDVDQLVIDTRDRLVGAVLLGADRAVIAAALARHAPNLPVRVVDSGDDGAMSEVVTAAAELASPGDVVLLAPAAASMDMFTDYGHRGRAFAAAVDALGGAR